MNNGSLSGGTLFRLVSIAFFALLLTPVATLADDDHSKHRGSSFSIEKATYKKDDNRFKAKGNASNQASVDLFDADSGVLLATVNADNGGEWEYKVNNPAAIPCRLRADSSGKSDEKDVKHADEFPGGCGINGGGNTSPTANANGPYTGTAGVAVSFSSAGSVDPDGNIVSWAWDFGDGGTSSSASPSHVYAAAGSNTVTLTVTDDKGATGNDSTTAAITDNGGGNTPPTANANGPYAANTGVAVSFSSAGSTDPDGKIVSWAWDFGDGGTSSSANPSHAYTTAGNYTVTLKVTDNNAAVGNDSTTAVITDQGQQPNASINSTSQNGIPGAPVTEQPLTGLDGYRVFSANDLGMHCGDFDTRISSVLPPFNVVHTQVVQRGSDPSILGPGDGVEVLYSAASNPNDPILTGVNSAGDGPVLSSLAKDGTVFKTNFWDIAMGGTEPTALSAYRAFYPPGVLDAFAPVPDQGLPMPNVERLYLGDGALTAEQQSAPGRAGPYVNNDPQTFKLYTVDQPFFINFPFGYTSDGVNWFEAAGIPLTAFDDAGQENPWQLMRVQARSGNQVLASLDTVLPISGEANCGFCHNDPVDGGNGAATQALKDANIPVATVLDDPEFDVSVPLEVSKEYAADLNLVRLHDLEHGTDLENNTPVVCQSCHYTPALDLAQVGPKGSGDADANGREQTNVRSMSNVMHSHHATVKDTNGNLLFPDMPPPVDSQGNLRNPVTARAILQDTCYQCHPGRRTDCLRGAMASGGMLCQDCHGDMAQVGNDFSKFVTPQNPGDFRLASDFYTNANTLRVPWANEPSCGSCHTGDAMNNMHGDPGTIGDPEDGIRLMQAYLTTDPKATPIVPNNKRFAENTVPASFNGKPNPGAGNPMLYRVSKGHEGIFCEACHGSTHGIWPNKNPNANDNITAKQLQGHTGVIAECDVCHTGDIGITLEGPHGMHPVGVSGLRFANGGHEDLAEDNKDACRACHGRNGQGTVLSKVATDRSFVIDECEGGSLCPGGGEVKNFTVNLAKGTQVSCTLCHENEL